MANAQRIIGTSALVAVGVGSVNAIAKNKTLPSSRFLIGSGVAFFILSALAEGEPELAQNLAMAIAVFVVLGEGGGVLSYINKGEMDTQKSFTPKHPKMPATSDDLAASRYRSGVPYDSGTVVVPAFYN